MASSRSEMYYGDYRFRPVPIFSWTTETLRDGKGEELSLVHTLDFTGTILPQASESGQLDDILVERQRLQQALASGGKEFRIFYDGIPQLSGIYPRITNVAFAEDIWVSRIDYNFQATYEEDFYNEGIQSYSETWAFEENEDRRSVTVQHDISAVGIDTNPSGVNNAITNARTFILAKTGYSNVVANHPAFVQASGVSTDAYEELRSEQVDVVGGSVSVSETFTLSSGNYVHVRTAQYSEDSDGISTVSLDGNIRGLGRGDVAYQRALSAWNTRIKPFVAADASGIYSELGGSATLHTNNFESFSVTRDTFNGTIDYSLSYTDDPSEDLPSGVLEFSINVQDQAPVKLFASFPIPERVLGNVVQDVGTSTEGTYTVSGNATGKQGFAFTDLKDFVEGKINNVRPIANDYVTLRLSSFSVTEDEDNNNINFNIAWTYTKELSQVKVDGEIIL